MFVAELRRVADVLDGLSEQAQQLSGPVYKTGWTYPIGTISGLPIGMRMWAEKLDRLIAQDHGDPTIPT